MIFAMGHVGETTSPDGVGDKADPTVRTHFSRSQHSAMLHICFLDSQLQDLLAAGADSQTVPPPVL